MPTIIRKNWILTAAVAAVPLLIAGATASAQYRVNNNDGRALDANNRLGSGGYNTGREFRGPSPSGNDIVTGNVTGLNYFHGRVDYTDPRAFRGRSQTFNNSDQLVRAAGAQPSPDNPNITYTPEGRLFFGESRAVAPPPTAQQIAPGVPGYVSSAQVQPRSIGDQRLGDVSSGSLLDRPRADQLILPGPANQQGQQTSIVGSALLGIRPTTGDEQFFLSGMSNFDRSRGLQLDDATIARMRAELGGGALPQPDAGQPTQANQPGADGAQIPPGPGALQNQPLNNQAPGNQVQNQPLNSQLAAAPGAQTDQTQRQRLLIPPERQSEQYREMLKKYNQMEAERKMTAQEAARAYNELTRLSQQPPQPGAPGAQPSAPGAQPGAPGAQPGAVLPGADRPAGTPSVTQQQPGAGAAPGAAKPAPREVKKPEPVKVPSMAAGVGAKGLADLMKQAEDLMKQGKYNAALDKYDDAQKVAPNNPMISMGRAIAELGGSYFARADGHIREAFTANPALMVAEYDLRNFLGEERLGALVKDLRTLAEKEKRDPRPTFLLAFIAYNTGQHQAAEGYLSLAEKRAGGRDPFYKTLRSTWTIPDSQPQAAPTTQPNK